MQPGSPDIRGEVEKSRGLLKKIQLRLPFYKGYRQLEDLREADELLRKQISDILVEALKNLQEERVSLVNQGKFDDLTSIASEISVIQEFQGDIAHAQQGYSGISPAIRMNEARVSSLYDYDLKFIDAADKIAQLSKVEGTSDLSAALASLSEAVNTATDAWNKRMATVKEILQSHGGGQ